MRRLSAVTLTVLMCVLTACGGGGGGDSDEDQIKSAVEQFATGVLDKDSGKACGVLTAKAVEEFSGDAGGDCEKLLDLVSEAITEEDRKEFENPKVTEIKVDGDSATAKVDGDETRFTKDGGDWKIDGTPTG